MTKEHIHIKDGKYILYINYQQDETLRLEFNRMTQEFWKFDFENYYQSGFWDDNCILYSLFDGDKIVSHTTVSLFENELKILIQLGTVMTDIHYQKRGLSRFLMERIMCDFKGKHDGIFLFANETVLDFYPKFGLMPMSEFECFFSVKSADFVSKLDKRRLNLDVPEDLRLFETCVDNAVPNSMFSTKNKAMSFFYCYAYPEMGFKDSIFFIDELNCVVVAQIEEEILYLIDIFAPNEISLKGLTGAFSDFSFEVVVFGFTPKETAGFHLRSYKEDDLQLFVSPELQRIFEKEQLRVNLLSHT
ncbi:GNAT family N-acetyltransferase [Pedobacter sp. KBW06]|uniref:GNAT family N-acetyltransferase n=1 Tax=Pedobacter sp. KBW06 TaxID=2153359 RepID=UPI000F5B5119|nr:GNAT family N-acetyltransferase [Pedobacter sp. KBW06]RQO74406.1 GNAT family N-acetyltransferase [Pedobacter sp. KBW06]